MPSLSLAIAPISLLRFGLAFPEAFWTFFLDVSWTLRLPSTSWSSTSSPWIAPFFTLLLVWVAPFHPMPQLQQAPFLLCIPIHPFCRYSWGASVALRAVKFCLFFSKSHLDHYFPKYTPQLFWKHPFFPIHNVNILTQSFKTYSLSTYYVSGTVLASRDIMVQEELVSIIRELIS